MPVEKFFYKKQKISGFKQLDFNTHDINE